MKIIIAALLLATLTFQLSRAYPFGRASYLMSQEYDSETAKASYVVGQTKALTLFVRDNRLKVYNEPGPYGSTLAELDLNNGQQTRSNSKLAYYPDYPNGATTYYFNLGDMIAGLDRKDACTLFESESDYPRINPVRSVGADGLGNHIGRDVFNKETYTFWITYDQSKYVLPHSGSYDWEAQIVCVMK